MNIAGIEIGRGHPCRFIVEISNAHNGDFYRAIRLIDAAAASGAEFCKFQAYLPSELVALRGDGPAPEPWGSQGWSMYDLYAKAATPFGWFAELFSHACAKGMVPFSSVFGAESLELMESLGAPAYKLASLDVKQRGLLKLVADTGKPLIRSAPGKFPPNGSQCFLYCPPGYPQPAVDFSVLANGYTGFSYHGTDPAIPGLAVSHGAKLVECHIQLDEEPSELEANVSLTGSQFASLVADAKCGVFA